MPELDPALDMQNIRTARNSSCLSTGKAMEKLLDKTGPIKGITGLTMNTTKNSKDSKMMMTFLNQSVNKLDHKYDIDSI